MRRFVTLVCGAVVAAFCPAKEVRAELDYPPAPCTVLSGHPCHPAFCSVFQRGPCFPQYDPPIGQTLWRTVAASEQTAKDKPVADRSDEAQLVNSIHDMFAALRVCWLPPPKDKARSGMEYTVFFAFNCNGELIAPARVTYATHGVPIEVRNVYRDAVEATLKRCTPMHFSTGMAGAIAGRPIAVRFFDDRIMIDYSKKGDDPSK